MKTYAESYETLKFEKKDGIGYVTVSRPKALNALNTTVIEEMTDLFRVIDRDTEVRVVIVTGEGRAFVAGADIAQMSKLSVIELRQMTKDAQEMMECIENIDQPVIAAVNGFALGGGCELAMACDIRLASENAKFGQPEVNLGIMPFFGGTQRLPRLIGKGMAKYLIYSTEMIDANEALRIGLVQKLYSADDLIPEAEKLAKVIMTKAPLGIKMAKFAIDNGANLDLRSGVAYELEAAVSTFCSEDKVEGMAAFLEKRSAEFKYR